MKRRLIALIILIHGLAHASVGMWAFNRGPNGVITALWGVAMIGYLAAGAGILRAPLLRHWWKQILIAATASSILLLMFFGHRTFIAGLLLDGVIIAIALLWAQRVVDAGVEVADFVGASGMNRPMLHRIAWIAAWLAIIYAALVVVARPTLLTWGTSVQERMMWLPGDPPVQGYYAIDHAITINAPAREIWPWMLQIGQDRGGFYSHQALERLFGVRINNATRIHDEWQNRSKGDFVRAVQPEYLGGALGDSLGWRITELIPERTIALQNWGSFNLVPIDSLRTRLIIRTRGEGTPDFLSVCLGWINVFVFEPAHFIMQREMMRGIRDRAENHYESTVPTVQQSR